MNKNEKLNSLNRNFVTELHKYNQKTRDFRIFAEVITELKQKQQKKGEKQND